MSKNPLLTCSGCGRTWYGDVKYAGTPHTECKSKGQWSLLTTAIAEVATPVEVTEVAVTELVTDRYEGAYEAGSLVTPVQATGTLEIGQWYEVVSRYPMADDIWYDLRETVGPVKCISRGISGRNLTSEA